MLYEVITPADGSAFRRIGVAIAQQPTGPFVPEPDYIQGIGGIDPNIFIDDDGRTYLYFGGGEQLNVVELNEDLVSIKGQVAVVQGLPAGYKEGSFVFKRNGIYYFTFPHAPGASEEIAYAMGKSPLGPFEYQGVIIDRWTDGCWTNHHSIVEYRGQWYIFYHHFETVITSYSIHYTKLYDGAVVHAAAPRARPVCPRYPAVESGARSRGHRRRDRATR